MSKQKLISALANACKLLTATKHHEKKIEKLQDALEVVLAIVVNIRYQNWPTAGLGIGLEAHEMDEAIQQAEAVLPKRPKKKRS